MEQFNIAECELLSTNPTGKFYLQQTKTSIYEVSPEIFIGILVTTYNCKDYITPSINSFDYLFEQIELNDDWFQALLFKQWYYEKD